MAIVACADCGKEVSDRAEKCPHCGRVSPGAYSRKGFNWWWALIVFVALFATCFLMLKGSYTR